MKSPARIAMAAAAALLILMDFFPMWRITLEAPQYPETLGLRIYIDAIAGAKYGDLENINGLNHYIGMKRIEPDSIAELKYIRYIIGFFIIFGFVIALVGKRNLIVVWLALLMAGSITGLVDFYMWEYDYGHNLDPRAIIKIPGMDYQPPFIGSKELLNFTAHSYPDIAGYLACLSIALAIYAFWISKPQKTENTDKNGNKADIPVLPTI